MVNHMWASTASGGTPRPWPYMPPRLYCARVWPCSAARRYPSDRLGVARLGAGAEVCEGLCGWPVFILCLNTGRTAHREGECGDHEGAAHKVATHYVYSKALVRAPFHLPRDHRRASDSRPHALQCGVDHHAEAEARRPREVRRRLALAREPVRPVSVPSEIIQQGPVMQVDRAAGPSLLDAVRNSRGCDVELLSRLGEALAAGRGFEEAQTFKRRKGLHGPQSAVGIVWEISRRFVCLQMYRGARRP